MPTLKGRAPTFDSVIQKVLEEKGSCPSTDPGAKCINDWVFDASKCFAYWLARYCIEPDLNRVADWIRANMTRKENASYEVARQVERAFASKGGGTANIRQATPKVDFNLDALCDEAAKVPEIITHEWLVAHSPEPTDICWTEYNRRVHGVGATVYVTTDMEKQCGVVTHYEVGHVRSEDLLSSAVQRTRHGAWGIVNAFKPEARRTTDGDLQTFDHCLIESDLEDVEHLWLRFVVQIPGVVSLITSGNVSIHALVRIPATSLEEFYKHRENILIPRYVPLGACQGSLTASRLTRLPNVVRGDNGRMQKLLYLKSDVGPDETIYKRNDLGG
jgi:hypothetical protein